MIHYLVTERFASTIRRYVRGNPAVANRIRLKTYEELFFEGAAPVGHYIFTDFDRLTRFEIECAAIFARELRRHAPEARILNHPLRALERFPLLVALHRAGVNSITATRIESGDRPPAYPVFIRAEDDCRGPETDILRDDAAFDAALDDLERRGLPRKGRIAIGYASECGEDGFFRKYGAFRIGDRILPHHLQRNRSWVVKRDVPKREFTTDRNAADRLAEAAVAEEFAFVRDNPHEEVLRKAFDIGGIEFGRADYGVVDGKVVIYEINTNPTMPLGEKSDHRDHIRAIARPRMTEAFLALDTPLADQGRRIGFSIPKPKSSDTRFPVRSLPGSLARVAGDLIRRPARLPEPPVAVRPDETGG